MDCDLLVWHLLWVSTCQSVCDSLPEIFCDCKLVNNSEIYRDESLKVTESSLIDSVNRHSALFNKCHHIKSMCSSCYCKLCVHLCQTD